MGEHEIANRLRLLGDNLTQSLIEQFIAKFARDLIERRSLRVLHLETHLYHFICAMLKMDKTAVRKPVNDFHQGRLVIDPEVDLRKKALAIRL